MPVSVAAQTDTASVSVYDRADLRIIISASNAAGDLAPCTRSGVILECRAFRGDEIRFAVTSIVDTVTGDDLTTSVAIEWATDNASAVSLNPATGVAVAQNRARFRVWPVVRELVSGIGFLQDAGNTPPRISPGGYGEWFLATAPRDPFQVPPGTYFACVYWQDRTGAIRAKSTRALVGFGQAFQEDGVTPAVVIYRPDVGVCLDELVGNTPLPVVATTFETITLGAS